MGRRDFSWGHPRVGQWVWIDEGKDYVRLGVVQGPKHSEPSCTVTRQGRVTSVVSTAVLGGIRLAAPRLATTLPDAVCVALVDPQTGGQSGDAIAEVEVDRLTPLLDKRAIPRPRRALMAANWQPRP